MYGALSFIGAVSYGQSVLIDAKGANGSDARHGQDGSFSGADGSDAGRSTPGDHAKDFLLILEDEGTLGATEAAIVNTKVWLFEDLGAVESSRRFRSSEAKEASQPLRAPRLRGSSEQIAPQSVNSYTAGPHGPRFSIDARGGRGGNGGFGGDGATGSSGSNGRNASGRSGATDGGPGGRGGDGGDGSPGSNGGRGGHGTVRFKADDLHLALLMERIDVSGGAGGEAGRNGSGGSGGPGGRGGSSDSYQVKTGTETYEIKHGDGSVSYGSRDIMQTYTTPGGSDGSTGSSGYSGSGRTHAGEAGPNGSFRYELVQPDGRVQYYTSTSRLELVSFSVTDSTGGIIEPNDTLYLEKITIRNLGEMPSPQGKASVMVRLNDNHWLKSITAPVELPQIMHNDVYQIPGRYEFRVAASTGIGQNGRWTDSTSVSTLGQVPRIFFNYQDFNYAQTLPITHPLEISVLKMPETLAPGETSDISYRLTNISSLPLGNSSESQREIVLSLIQATQKSLPFKLQMNDATVDLAEDFVFAIGQLGAGEQMLLQGKITLPESIDPYTSVDFMQELKLPLLGSVEKAPRTIQQNRISLRIGMKFRHTKGSDILLVTNHHSERAEVLAWLGLIDELGLKADIWDASYYGHVDLKRTLEDGKTLGEHFRGKTIIVLNNRSNRARTSMGSDALSAEDLISAASQRVSFYILGGDQRRGFLPWMMATDPEDLDIVENAADIESFRNPSPTLMKAVPVFKATKDAWSTIAKRVSHNLSEAFPHHRYILDSTTNNNSQAFDRVFVRRTINPDSGRALYLAASDAQVHSDHFVRSDENIISFLLTLPFQRKLQVFLRASRNNQVAWAQLSSQAIVHDMVEQIDTWRRISTSHTKESRIAWKLEFLLGYFQHHFRDEVPSEQTVRDISRQLAQVSFYLENVTSNRTVKDLRKYLSYFFKKRLPELFSDRAHESQTFIDKEKQRLKQKFKLRRRHLIALDDDESLQRLLVYPSRGDAETSDDVLKKGNWVNTK